MSVTARRFLEIERRTSAIWSTAPRALTPKASRKHLGLIYSHARKNSAQNRRNLAVYWPVLALHVKGAAILMRAPAKIDTRKRIIK